MFLFLDNGYPHAKEKSVDQCCCIASQCALLGWRNLEIRFAFREVKCLALMWLMESACTSAMRPVGSRQETRDLSANGLHLLDVRDAAPSLGTRETNAVCCNCFVKDTANFWDCFLAFPQLITTLHFHLSLDLVKIFRWFWTAVRQKVLEEYRSV